MTREVVSFHNGTKFLVEEFCHFLTINSTRVILYSKNCVNMNGGENFVVVLACVSLH